jgi:lysozyme
MIKGIDVAFYEPNIDWRRVRAAGNEFAFIKATQRDYEDSKFREHKVESRGFVARGPYHFYEPTVSPRIQAEFFWETVKDEPWELDYVVDIELYRSGIYHGGRFWYDFISRFQILSGKYPMIYTGYYYWNDEVKKNPVLDLNWFAEHCPLWIAAYGSQPLIPRPWTDWTYWQYSGSGLVNGVMDDYGRPTECDLDYGRGTPTPPPDTGDIPMPKYDGIVLDTATPYVNLRDNPLTGAQDIGNLYPKDVITADEVRQTDRTWLHITSINGQAATGWAAASFVEYHFIEEPNPSSEYILHVKDGVTRKFVPEV